MRATILLLISTIIILNLHASPIIESDEINSHEAAFHHAIHRSIEFYLVCIFDVEKKPWGEGWEQLKVNATVVQAIKGKKSIGEKINFRRVLDGKYGDISHLNGALYFVR